MSVDRRSIGAALLGLAGGAVLPSHGRDDAGQSQARPLGRAPALGHFSILNAYDFGAAGDGRTDDTVALQAFLDAVVTGGLRGYIPTGTYRTTAPLRVGNDDSKSRFRGFVIEGAGRVGLEGARPTAGGTLILLDAPGTPKAVLSWAGNAWRDARLTSLGLASRRLDGAEFGLFIESSEISQLEFDHLHVENVTTAFGLARGTGANGEFCGWSNVQTWHVRNYFWSDAGQAYGLRFRDSFCYYRSGGTLFRFETGIVGGGLRLINFDASATLPNTPRPPTTRADTTLFALGNKHNAPITVIGGRFEHITTLVDVDTDSVDIVVHNQVQFIGSDFTTDLDRAGAATGKATVRLRSTALADLRFIGCSFATALHKRTDIVVAIVADRGCRGSIRFDQCGYWGYAQKPITDAPVALRLAWTDCMFNTPGRGDWQAQTHGDVFDYRVHDPVPVAPVIGNVLLQSGVVGPASPFKAAEPWQHRGVPAFAGPAFSKAEGSILHLSARAGIYQDVVMSTLGLHYRAHIALPAGAGSLRLSLSDPNDAGRVIDEQVIRAVDDRDGHVVVALQAPASAAQSGKLRVGLDNVGERSLVFEITRQHASEHPDTTYVATLDEPVLMTPVSENFTRNS